MADGSPLELDRDVAEWLHGIADRWYGGDVQLTMNRALRSLMVKHPGEPNPDPNRVPEDPWNNLVPNAPPEGHP